MEVILYSTGCPKCNVLKMKLNQMKISYSLVEDVDQVVKIGVDHGITSAPILEIDGVCYDFSNAFKKLKEVK